MMMTRQELLNECDMLDGNKNRIAVTDDLKELDTMYISAIRRLTRIYESRKQELGLKELAAKGNEQAIQTLRDLNAGKI